MGRILKNKYIIVIWISVLPSLILLTGCEHENRINVPVVKIGNQLFEPEELYLSDVASEMKIIQLETNDSCLIGRGRNFDWTTQGLILNDIGLMKFDTTGCFQGNVFRFGQGPDELTAMKDYYVKDTLIYLTGLSKDLYVYTYSGTLLESFQIPIFTHNGFAVLGDDKFVTGMQEWGGKAIDKVGRLRFFSRSGVKKTLYKSYSTEGKYPESYPMGKEIKFYSYRDTVYMKELLCDTIYFIDTKRDTIFPFLAYDFGNYKTHPEYRYNYPVDELFFKFPYTQFLGVTGDNVFLVVMMADVRKQESIDMLCIYNRLTGQSRLVRLSYSEQDIQTIKTKLGNNFDEKVSRYFVPISLSQDGKYLCTLLPQITDENPAILAISLK